MYHLPKHWTVKRSLDFEHERKERYNLIKHTILFSFESSNNYFNYNNTFDTNIIDIILKYTFIKYTNNDIGNEYFDSPIIYDITKYNNCFQYPVCDFTYFNCFNKYYYLYNCTNSCCKYILLRYNIATKSNLQVGQIGLMYSVRPIEPNEKPYRRWCGETIICSIFLVFSIMSFVYGKHLFFIILGIYLLFCPIWFLCEIISRNKSKQKMLVFDYKSNSIYSIVYDCACCSYFGLEKLDIKSDCNNLRLHSKDPDNIFKNVIKKYYICDKYWFSSEYDDRGIKIYFKEINEWYKKEYLPKLNKYRIALSQLQISRNDENKLTQIKLTGSRPSVSLLEIEYTNDGNKKNEQTISIQNSKNDTDSSSIVMDYSDNSDGIENVNNNNFGVDIETEKNRLLSKVATP